jgi:integrase/recombinase XerD
LPVKLTTTIQNIETKVSNSYNRELILRFYEYLRNIDTSENYQNGVIKAIIHFSEFFGSSDFNTISKKEEILKFLDSKRKSIREDPEQKWITTWNDYLWRIKYFYRWLYNYLKGQNENVDEWKTPDFINIKKKRTKRLSPYSEGDIWDKDELLSIVKYEPNKRNRAILTLLWDLNARPHKITLLRIKNIRLREKYGEGEIPHQAKTGTGPILLTISFPYVRDWLNEHPYRNEQDARLICNVNNGSAIRPDSICDLMKNLRKHSITKNTIKIVVLIMIFNQLLTSFLCV